MFKTVILSESKIFNKKTKVWEYYMATDKINSINETIKFEKPVMKKYEHVDFDIVQKKMKTILKSVHADIILFDLENIDIV